MWTSEQVSPLLNLLFLGIRTRTSNPRHVATTVTPHRLNARIEATRRSRPRPAPNGTRIRHIPGESALLVRVSQDASIRWRALFVRSAATFTIRWRAIASRVAKTRTTGFWLRARLLSASAAAVHGILDALRDSSSVDSTAQQRICKWFRLFSRDSSPSASAHGHAQQELVLLRAHSKNVVGLAVRL